MYLSHVKPRRVSTLYICEWVHEKNSIISRAYHYHYRFLFVATRSHCCHVNNINIIHSENVSLQSKLTVCCTSFSEVNLKSRWMELCEAASFSHSRNTYMYVDFMQANKKNAQCVANVHQNSIYPSQSGLHSIRDEINETSMKLQLHSISEWKASKRESQSSNIANDNGMKWHHSRCCSSFSNDTNSNILANFMAEITIFAPYGRVENGGTEREIERSRCACVLCCDTPSNYTVIHRINYHVIPIEAHARTHATKYTHTHTFDPKLIFIFTKH